MSRKYILVAAVLAAIAFSACDNATSKTAGQDAAVAGFTPSGDPEKDARQIADFSREQSRLMMDGKSNPDEQMLADKMIELATDYYRGQDRVQEFQSALREATEEAVNDLATELGH